MPLEWQLIAKSGFIRQLAEVGKGVFRQRYAKLGIGPRDGAPLVRNLKPDSAIRKVALKCGGRADGSNEADVAVGAQQI